jgi:gliding motility-associated-like protein
MNRNFSFLILLLLCLVSFNGFATHSAGMDLTYKCIGGNQYEFTMKLIRFCGGVNVPNEYYLNVTSSQCGLTKRTILNRVGPGTDITPTCVGVSTNCDDPNSTIQGYEQHIFKGIVTLNTPCRDWKAVVCDHARNNDISTLSNPGSSSLCVYALINNQQAACNNSPTFSNNPNAFVCVNNNLCFNNVVTDADGDNLVFELTKPLKCTQAGGCYSNNYVNYSQLTPVTYASNSLSYTDPFQFAPPIQLDPVSGNFCILPTGIEKTVMAMKVSEYRNGVLIGEVIRDIQVVVFNCSNSVPQLGGINSLNNTNTDTVAEVGQQLSFQIPSYDPDMQALNMSYSNLPGNSTLTINQVGTFPVGNFNWTPALGDTGLFCFNVAVNDLSAGNCDYFSTASKSFCIRVVDCANSNLTLNIPDTLCTNAAVFNLSTSPVVGSYNWSGAGVVNSVTGEYNAALVQTATDTIRLISTYGICVKEYQHVVRISQAPPLNVQASSLIACNGKEIQLSANQVPIGNEGPYYGYTWAPAAVLNNPNIVNPTAIISAPTTFYVTITDLSNGCSRTGSIFIDFSTNAPIVNAANTDTLCTGGTIVLGGSPTASGGTFPYTYEWSPASNLTSDVLPNPTLFNAVNGWINVYVVDANGCKGSDSVYIRVKAGFSADASLGSDTVCTGGSIVLGGNPQNIGGTAPYYFNWAPPTYLNNTAIYNPIYSASGAVAHYTTYQLLVVDAEGCIDIDSVTVHYDPNAVRASAGASDTVCTGGSIQLGGNPTAIGGLAPFNYVWTPNQFINFASTASPIVFPPTSMEYVVKVTDANNCSDLDTVFVRKTTGPIADAGPDSVCTGGTIYVGGNPTASLGVAPYTYTWIPNQYIDVSNSASNPAVFPPSSQYYVVSVTDAEGCSDLDSTYVTVFPGPDADAGGQSDLCTSGSVQLGGVPSASNGIAPYTYDWNYGGLLNDSTIANPITINVFDSVHFVLQVTDARGCIDIDSAFVVYYFKAPIVDAGFGEDTLCSSGQIMLGGNPTVYNGTPPYVFEWTPTSTLTNSTIANPVSFATSTTTYQLVVTDSNNCTGLDFITVIFNPNGPTADAGFGEDTICSGGTVMLGGNPTAIGGIAPITYLWTPNYALTSNTSANPLSYTHTDTLYVLMVRDSEGCSDLDSVFVDFNPNGPNANAGGINDSLCTGGTLILGGNPTAANGVAPYVYLWTPSTGLSSTSISNPFTTLASDQQYVLFIEDAIGCRDIDSVFVSFGGPIADAGLDTLCIINKQVIGGDPTAQGGQAPYLYNWAPNYYLSDNSIANPLTETPVDTTYVLTVVDAAGCIDMDSTYLIHHDLEASFIPVLDDIIAPADVYFENTSTYDALVVSPSYVWDFGDSTTLSILENPTHTYLSGGYTTITLVAFSDETKLCSDTFAYTVLIYPPAQIIVPNVITPNGDGLNDVFEVQDEGIDVFNCIIYNRWGTEVYRFDELDNKWDGRNYSGTPMPEGTYFYMIEATGHDRKELSLKGAFALLR